MVLFVYTVLLPILSFVLGVFVWHDAKKTGASYPLVFGIGVFFLPYVFFPLYVIYQYRRLGDSLFDGLMRWFSVLIFVVIVLFAGLGKTDSVEQKLQASINEQKLQTNTNEVAKEVARKKYEEEHPYTIVDEKFDIDKYKHRIYTGIFIPKKDLKHVYIEIKIFDKNDAVIGYSNDAISNLKKGERWKFKMDIDHVTEERCSVLISKVSAY